MIIWQQYWSNISTYVHLTQKEVGFLKAVKNSNLMDMQKTNSGMLQKVLQAFSELQTAGHWHFESIQRSFGTPTFLIIQLWPTSIRKNTGPTHFPDFLLKHGFKDHKRGLSYWKSSISSLLFLSIKKISLGEY